MFEHNLVFFQSGENLM